MYLTNDLIVQEGPILSKVISNDGCFGNDTDGEKYLL